jgi:hypothetical protein
MNHTSLGMMSEKIHQRTEERRAKLNPRFMEFSTGSVPGILCPKPNNPLGPG